MYLVLRKLYDVYVRRDNLYSAKEKFLVCKCGCYHGVWINTEI